jgi:hypothetical protein
MPCPTCGATDGFVLDADGKVSSCKSCDETRERTSRKDQIDSDALKKAAREPVKDAIDLGLKAAGVVVAAGVFLKKTVSAPDGGIHEFYAKAPGEHDFIIAALWRAGLRMVDSLFRSVTSEYWVLPLRNGHLIEMGHVPEAASMRTYYECLSNLGLSPDEFELLVTKQAYHEDVVFLLCIMHLIDKHRYTDARDAARKLNISGELESRFLEGHRRKWNADERNALAARLDMVESLDSSADVLSILHQILPTPS